MANNKAAAPSGANRRELLRQQQEAELKKAQRQRSVVLGIGILVLAVIAFALYWGVNTRAAQDQFNAELQHKLSHTEWNTGGCASWYLDAHGKNTTLWPRSTFAFRGLLAKFDRDAYRVATTTTDRELVTA